jgi:hypothetical protein
VAGPALVACALNEVVNVGANFEAGAPPVDATGVVDVVDAEPREAEAAPDVTSLDDGVPDDAALDVETGPPPLSELCIPNPSFELTPALPTTTPVLTAPPAWASCNNSNSQTASACGLDPTLGDTYLGLAINVPLLIPAASVDVVPCGPVLVGATYAVTLDLAIDAPGADGGQDGEPPALQLLGSNTPCDPRGDPLHTFAGLDRACGWKTLCGTFVAHAAYTDFVLVPQASSSLGSVFVEAELLVDNLRTDLPCPPQ